MANDLAEHVPVIFNTAIEGLVRTYGDRITPALKNEMVERGVNLDKLQPAYSLEVFERAFRHFGQALYPQLDDTERWRVMGREFTDGFGQTTMGKAITGMARLLGPRRTLERIGRTFRAGSNYLGAETVVLGPTEVELRTWMLEVYLEPWRGIPTLQLDYRVGILEGLMAGLNARGATVTMVEKDLQTQSARYRIRWEA